jgi:hypothetical protein
MILIAGDSWGAGEWPQRYSGPKNTLHGGVSQYLSENGKEVINLSRAGASNIEIISSLQLFFDSNTNKYLTDPITDNLGQGVFVFQSEWYRVIAPITPSNQSESDFISKVDTEMPHRYAHRFYHALKDIAQKHRVRINLIGGSSDVVWLDDFEEQFPGLHVVCQSLTNLCVHDNHRIDQAYLGGISFQAAELLKKRRNDTKMVEFLESMINQTFERSELWNQYNQWFWPDGKHVNRQGHQKLYDFLLSHGHIR